MQPFVHKLCINILNHIGVPLEQDASLLTCAIMELFYFQKSKRTALEDVQAHTDMQECYKETMRLCACVAIALKYLGYDELFVCRPAAIYLYCLRAIALYMKQEVYNRPIKSGVAWVSVQDLFDQEYEICELADWRPFPKTIKAFGFYSQCICDLSTSASMAQFHVEQMRLLTLVSHKNSCLECTECTACKVPAQNTLHSKSKYSNTQQLRQRTNNNAHNAHNVQFSQIMFRTDEPSQKQAHYDPHTNALRNNMRTCLLA